MLIMSEIKSGFSRKRSVHIAEGSAGTLAVVRRELHDHGKRCGTVNVLEKRTINARILATLTMVITLFRVKLAVKNRFSEK